MDGWQPFLVLSWLYVPPELTVAMVFGRALPELLQAAAALAGVSAAAAVMAMLYTDRCSRALPARSLVSAPDE